MIGNNNNSKGFSLIELSIVLAIFLIVVTAMINIFTAMVAQQKKVLAQQELLNQTSFVMGYLSHALKFAAIDLDGACLGAPGRMYLLTHCQNNACSGVTFISAQDGNACVEVFLDEVANPQNPPLRQIKNGGDAQNLLSEALKVKYARFIINGDKTLSFASDSDILQPKITILLDVQTQGDSPQEKVIQTSVSLRDLIK